MKNIYSGALPIESILKSPEREYRIEAILGHGGFGITYKVSAETVTPIQVGNIVQSKTVRLYFAVKEFFMKGCDRGLNGQIMTYASTLENDVKASLQDFLTEARRLNKIGTQSKNIVKVNEVFEANGTAYYVMEYLDGGSMADYVMKHGPMLWKDARTIITPIAQAVELLHKEKLLHMDIKPDNIMLKHNMDGTLLPVLIDFGISKHFDSKGNPTSQLMAKGASDGYAPQEQYAGIEKFAPEIDVYALGATILYLLTGKQLPKAFDVQLINSAIGQLPSSIPTNIRYTITQAMKPSKYDRLHDVNAFLCSLINEEQKEEIKTDYPKTGENKTKIFDSKKSIDPKPTPRSISKLPFYIVILVCIIAFAYVLWLDTNGKSDSQKLTEAISNNDSTLLHNYANMDSIRAFCPYALCLLEKGDTATALVYANKAKSTADSITATIILSTIEKNSNKATSVNVETVKTNDDKSTKSETTKERVQKENQTNVETKETDDQKYKQAIKTNDKSTLKSLASKGYSKAYSKVASIYLKENNYSSADTYARQALHSNVGKSEAITVIEILDGYGYYDNGEHGGKPQY